MQNGQVREWEGGRDGGRYSDQLSLQTTDGTVPLLGRIDHTSHVLVREGGTEGRREGLVVREREGSGGREEIENMRRRMRKKEEEEAEKEEEKQQQL